jgi:O-acetyl-ADP-ribose deacetylase (regulator of RNase III)
MLTGIRLRPANLLFAEIFKDWGATNLPGTRANNGKVELFKFKWTFEEVVKFINEKNPVEVFEISTANINSMIYHEKVFHEVPLKEYYGTNKYKMSYGEIQQTLKSQRIYTSPSLPLKFYQGLKQAMIKDEIVTLPGIDSQPVKLEEFDKFVDFENTHSFLNSVKENHQVYGFASANQVKELFKYTIYEIGAMVVKTEDYRILIDGDGRIFKRNANQNDAFRLINACGIRGFHCTKTDKEKLKSVIAETFVTALIAAQGGFVVFPAVGMGIWGGDPAVYWPAFLEAVIKVGNNYNFDAIIVNPNHQKTKKGPYLGFAGNEFQLIFNQFNEEASKKGDTHTLKCLAKIINLEKSKQCVVQLAHQLKQKFPDKQISLFNASDPDVTLGNHVGEYVNNCPHNTTTEENYTAMGTNGLCFEGITKIHEDPSRLFHVNNEGQCLSRNEFN